MTQPETVDPWYVPRMALTASLVAVESTLRVWTRSAKLCALHAPAILQLSRDASTSGGSTKVQAQLRDEVLGLARDVAMLGWLEARRAIDELDKRTRDRQATTDGPTRPQRAKR